MHPIKESLCLLGKVLDKMNCASSSCASSVQKTLACSQGHMPIMRLQTIPPRIRKTERKPAPQRVSSSFKNDPVWFDATLTIRKALLGKSPAKPKSPFSLSCPPRRKKRPRSPQIFPLPTIDSVAASRVEPTSGCNPFQTKSVTDD